MKLFLGERLYFQPLWRSGKNIKSFEKWEEHKINFPANIDSGSRKLSYLSTASSISDCNNSSQFYKKNDRNFSVFSQIRFLA